MREKELQEEQKLSPLDLAGEVGHGSADCTAGGDVEKEERGGEDLLATWGPPFGGF